MTIQLKEPIGSYQPRFNRFLKLMLRVKDLKPLDMHLWKVMDSVAFQDTETALKTTIYNVRAEERKQRQAGRA